jgi:hypothetical protein
MDSQAFFAFFPEGFLHKVRIKHLTFFDGAKCLNFLRIMGAKCLTTAMLKLWGVTVFDSRDLRSCRSWKFCKTVIFSDIRV